MCLTKTAETRITKTKENILVFKTGKRLITDNGEEYFLSSYKSYLYRAKCLHTVPKINTNLGFHSFCRLSEAKTENLYPDDCISIFLVKSGAKIMRGLFGSKQCYVSDKIMFLKCSNKKMLNRHLKTLMKQHNAVYEE